MSESDLPKIKITMFSVGDADAMIVELWRSSSSLVMVIDGGTSGDFRNSLGPALIEILAQHEKNAPDVVVCTHYDNDHIGGLIPLARAYGNQIGQVWVHPLPQVLTPFLNRQLRENIAAQVVQTILNEQLNRTLDLVAERNLILESVTQLNQFLALLPPASINPVFVQNQPVRPLPDWPEIEVLGPTQRYFNSLFNINRPEQFLLNESIAADSIHDRRLEEMQHLMHQDPCMFLDSNGNARQTATNRASIIIRIAIGADRYLFTGDASVESFRNLPDFPACISNLRFLKIPHHGSINNISHDLIRTMNPRYAFNSGNIRESPDVLACIRSTANAIVQTTRLGDDLQFPF